jgi:hypothetical protein
VSAELPAPAEVRPEAKPHAEDEPKLVEEASPLSAPDSTPPAEVQPEATLASGSPPVAGSEASQSAETSNEAPAAGSAGETPPPLANTEAADTASEASHQKIEPLLRKPGRRKSKSGKESHL